MDNNTKLSGTIKWFDSNKNYGFITPDDGMNDVFLHRSAIEASGISADSELEGQKVFYGLEKKNGRVSAVNLELAQTEE